MVLPHRHEGGRRLIGALLRIPSDEVRRRISADLGHRYPGLTTAHMAIFQHIDHPPAGTRQTDLAERIAISKQSLGELVDSMESLGLVERMADGADRRAKLVRLTALGWSAHQRALEIGAEIEAEWAGLIGHREFTTLVGLLQALEAALTVDTH